MRRTFTDSPGEKLRRSRNSGEAWRALDFHRPAPLGMKPRQHSQGAYFERARGIDLKMPEAIVVLGSHIDGPDHTCGGDQASKSFFVADADKLLIARSGGRLGFGGNDNSVPGPSL